MTFARVEDGDPYDATYTENAEGEILQRDELSSQYGPGQGPTNDYFYLDGQQVGETTNNGSDQPDFAASIAQRLTQPSSTSLWANSSSTSSGGAQLSSDFGSNYQVLNTTDPASTVSARHNLCKVFGRA